MLSYASDRNSISYHLYTIWLFTRSDLKTIVGPSTVFGLVGLLSGSNLTTGPSLLVLDVSKRVPSIALWVWINLLPFSIDNQRQIPSIEEDCQNKSWRALPSRRITRGQATMLMTVAYFLAVCLSMLLGGIVQCLGLIALGYWYNDLNGSDTNWCVRNLINACGYMCFISGALQVGSNYSSHSLKTQAYQWVFILALVIFTTIQSQDMHDQAGDRLRNRLTVPLTIGDSAARYTIAMSVAAWSWICPAFWQLALPAAAPTLTLGMIIIVRYLVKRSVLADRTTFRIYNIWIVSLYTLPLFTKLQGMQHVS